MNNVPINREKFDFSNNAVVWLVTAMFLLLGIPKHTYPVHPSNTFHLQITILAVVVVILFILQKRPFPSLPKMTWIGILLLSTGYILGSQHIRGWMQGALVTSNHILAAALVFTSVVVFRDEKLRLKLIPGLQAAYIVILASGIIYIALYGLGDTVNGVTGHGNVYAFLLITIFPWLFVTKNKKYNRTTILIRVFLVVLSFALLITTRSAAAIGAFVLPWCIFLWMRFYKKHRRLAFVILILGAACISLISIGLVHYGEVAVFERIQIYSSAWTLWLSYPFTGVGPGQFMYFYPSFRDPLNQYYVALSSYEPVSHVHLEPLHAMVEGGILSAMGLLLFTGVVIYHAFRILGKNNLYSWREAAAIATLSGILQGTVSLAPSREGILPLMISFGAMLATLPHKSQNEAVRANKKFHRTILTWFFVSFLLLASVPLRSERVIADFAYKNGRDWSQFWYYRDLHSLEICLEHWPEDIGASVLHAWGLYQEAQRYSGDRREQLFLQSLEELERIDRLAPDFYKVPLFKAYIFLELGLPEEGLEVLDQTRYFHEGEECRDLYQSLEHLRAEGDN